MNISFQEAVKIARDHAKTLHEGQFRRDGITPYFTHIEAVISRLDKEDWIGQIVAAYHDSVEDERITEEELRLLGYPDEILEPILLLTHSKEDSYEDYLRKMKSNSLATRVKIADILSNLSDSPTKKQILKYSRALIFLLGD